ncbi:MAG: cytochrome P450 [Rhizobiaceae bacterium]
MTLPPRVAPAPMPLSFPRNLVKLVTNNLELLPEAAYREELVVAPGPPRLIFAMGEELVADLLQARAQEFPKGALQNAVLDPLFGNAMISSHGKDWRWQRSLAAPMFRHEQLLAYGPIMNEAARMLCSDWRAAPEGAIRDISADASKATFHVIANTMLAGGASSDLADISSGKEEYFRYMNWWIVNRMLGLPAWLPRPGGRVMREQERKLRSTVRRLVDKRHAAMSEESKSGEDLLFRLLTSSDPETGQAMGNKRIVNNILAFLVAGYDTTALTLAWALYLLASEPDWQNRVREEVRQLPSAEVTTADHDKLVVTRQVVQETMRLYPTAPVIVRDIPEDTTIAGHAFKAGAPCIIPIYAIHRHHSYWKDPDRFDPQRFAPSAPKPGRFTYLPFGAGPRICIGAAFATLELSILLANLVRNACFETVHGEVPSPVGHIFLGTQKPIRLKVTPLG